MNPLAPRPPAPPNPATSGSAVARDPTTGVPIRVIVTSLVSSGREMPRSATHAEKSAETRTFAAFRSRWMIAGWNDVCRY